VDSQRENCAADMADLSQVPIASLAATDDPAVALMIERIAPQAAAAQQLKVARFGSGLGHI